MAIDTQLARANARLKALGARVTILHRRNGLALRATLPAKAGGPAKQQMIGLGLPADAYGVREASARALAVAEARDAGTFSWADWGRESSAPEEPEPAPGALTCAEAIEQLQAQFWAGRTRSSAAERTWDRIASELRRLPAQATLSVELLVAVAATTEAGSRTRLEFTKVAKRLGKVAGLEGLEQLDSLRGSYEPAERVLPSDEELAALLERIDLQHQYGWLTWAAITYGCRPAEAFSLRPKGDRTAQVLSVKRKGKAPTWRTALSLPVASLEPERSVPWDVASPSQYDSETARRLVQSWGKWFVRQAPGMQLYDLRHAWAVRSIRVGLNASLAAKCMGHSLAVHHSTYHRWLDESDVAAVAAALG